MSFARAVSSTSDRALEARARLLSALGHPIRLRIVQGLLSGECCVGNMAECLGLPQPLVSRHLAVLRQAGVVTVDAQGRRREYRVVHPAALALMRCLDAGESPCPKTIGTQRSAAQAARE